MDVVVQCCHLPSGSSKARMYCFCWNCCWKTRERNPGVDRCWVKNLSWNPINRRNRRRQRLASRVNWWTTWRTRFWVDRRDSGLVQNQVRSCVGVAPMTIVVVQQTRRTRRTTTRRRRRTRRRFVSSKCCPQGKQGCRLREGLETPKHGGPLG